MATPFGITNPGSSTRPPFDGPGKDENMVSLLNEALHLYGAIEGREDCVLKVKLRGEKVISIEVEDNKEKAGSPVIKGAYIVSGEVNQLTGGIVSICTEEDFFKRYVIDSQNPYPDNVRKAIEEIRKRLYTFEEDYTKEPIPFEYEENYDGVKVRFMGTILQKLQTVCFIII